MSLLRVLDGGGNAPDGWPCGFAAGRIFACGLAERDGVAGHVEHIINDLKGQTRLAAERGKSGGLLLGCAGEDTAADNADTDECAGLGTMDGEHRCLGRLGVLAFQIKHLPADHAVDSAGGLGDELYDADGGIGRAARPPSTEYARVCSASPARMAIASP